MKFNYLINIKKTMRQRRELFSELSIGLHTQTVYLGDSLKYFFSNMVINYNVNGITIDIMDYFPMLKEGYCVRDSIMLMLYNYCIFL